MRTTDPHIQAQLERLRLRVPRYLFRGWSKCSEGYMKYKSTKAITPRAFFHHPTHKSVHDMNTEVCKDMVLNHLQNLKDHPTEFSSWAASISLAMRFCRQPPHSSFISIIDTKKLKDKIEIFYTPDLSLFCGKTNYAGEYLAHGVIEGDYHRAVSYCTFTDLGVSPPRMPSLAHAASGYVQPLRNFVHVCRRIGEQYRARFLLPVALSIVSLFITSRKQSCTLSLLKDNALLWDIIEEVLGDLRMPGDWFNDNPMMKNVVADLNHPEVKQFIELL